LDVGSYKDLAPTEHDLGLPNVQTAVTGKDARALGLGHFQATPSGMSPWQGLRLSAPQRLSDIGNF
jgi:hypothetical protein